MIATTIIVLNLGVILKIVKYVYDIKNKRNMCESLTREVLFYEKYSRLYLFIHLFIIRIA